MISIIVAIANDNAIGRDNRLLCHIPGDLKRFREITSGHWVVMGKKTWESLPNKPLPNRTNLVITDVPGEQFDGCVMAYSIEDAVRQCPPGEESFIIGGGTIYRQFLPRADRLYLTRILKDFEADTWFPGIDYSQWALLSEEHHAEHLDSAGFEFTYQIWERK